jgi:hypothetical protein
LAARVSAAPLQEASSDQADRNVFGSKSPALALTSTASVCLTLVQVVLFFTPLEADFRLNPAQVTILVGQTCRHAKAKHFSLSQRSTT